ncbi:MAG: inositol monophosphatase [Gemmatimonadota bacterium]|nr:inositol monophosphatase [Gemmatimonadota bacterium]
MSAPEASQATTSPATFGARECAELLDIASRAAHAAAAGIRRSAGEIDSIVWRSKSHADFVSAVDVAAEESLRDAILREIPDAVIVGEELSPSASLGAITFIVDPLDGTTNFLHSFPWYAVSVAVFRDGAPAAGVVINVPTGDVHSAAAGLGARSNGHPIRVSAIDAPERALIGTGFPFKTPAELDRYAEQFKRVTRATAGIRRAGSAALDLADVALGRFDAFWELLLSPWDFAAGALIVREAGGMVTDIRGTAVGHDASSIVAGNPRMHAWLLATLTSVPE